MNGVPENIPLEQFVNKTVGSLQISMWPIQVHFEQVGYLAMESSWELRDVAGELVDHSCDSHAERESFRLHKILGLALLRYVVDSPKSVTLEFEKGWTLKVIDGNERYESFQLYLYAGGCICVV